MVEGGFQLQCAAPDVLSSRLYRDRCLRIEQLRWLVSDPSGDAISPASMARRAAHGSGKSSPDEQLIKPNFLGSLLVRKVMFPSETCFR